MLKPKSKYKKIVTYLCKLAGVSRSGYYNYFSEKSLNRRNTQNRTDEILKENILKAYKFKNRVKGAKQIKMTFLGQFGINYNLKRIRRIMKKYNIICPIRKANPYRRMMKATKEHRTTSNKLNRNFKQEKPFKVLITDIIYLFYGTRRKAYLSTIKDGSTNEILTYKLSINLKINIATDRFIHSDHGVHLQVRLFKVN